jgi:hypothetical protein
MVPSRYLVGGSSPARKKINQTGEEWMTARRGLRAARSLQVAEIEDEGEALVDLQYVGMHLVCQASNDLEVLLDLVERDEGVERQQLAAKVGHHLIEAATDSAENLPDLNVEGGLSGLGLHVFLHLRGGAVPPLA